VTPLAVSERAECDAQVDRLRERGFRVVRDTQNVGAAAYVIVRELDASQVMIYFGLRDWQVPTAGLVIYAMGVSPPEARSRGHGGRAVDDLLAWADEQRLGELRATQVSTPRSSAFWQRHGFEPVPGHPCGDHVRLSP